MDVKICNVNIKEDICFSILVLVHDAMELTSDFLHCLYTNTSVPFNLLVLDNGSSHVTEKFLHEKSLIHNFSLLRSPENLGVTKGRNSLLSFLLERLVSDDAIIGFLDNDQLVHRGWLKQYLHIFDNGYDIVGAEAWLMNKVFFPVEKIDTINRPFHYVGCGGMFIRKNVLDDVGILDPIFSPAYFEDPDICFRCLEKGYKIGWNANAKLTHLPHKTLGASKDNKRGEIFLSSYEKFCLKWRGYSIQLLEQKT